ncbi:LA_2478/LA_2722/LA_4182 family protein [Leptospira sp. GIMC2001]|uniref:LA_2478/LA_2722/LA_4182 family protein n=1 Tax=Leptospira sp. GIMC2001 TaxID=1513297 RepID=UPI00234AF1FB|nr:hypothetical protein [Leptospira sp. GIMC2001]WCL49726.1 hypothetical protein O4O04_02585 [Leptospira sp. GIMC2001]
MKFSFASKSSRSYLIFFARPIVLLAKSGHRMLRTPYMILLILFFLCQIDCKDRSKGVDDPFWREESLKIAGEICKKIANCGKETGAFIGLELSHTQLAENRLQEASCHEHHRNTNVYKLIGDNPDQIRSLTRDCYKEIIEMGCSDLVDKKYKKIVACELMGRIQRGESLE